MKWLNAVLMVVSSVAGAAEIPYVALVNEEPYGGANTTALFGLTSGNARLFGSAEIPVLSTSPFRTVATFVPGSVNEAGLAGYSQDTAWQYQIAGFSGTAFKGSSCTSCQSGFLEPVAISDHNITLKYNPLAGPFGQTGLVLSSALFNQLLSLPPGKATAINTSVRNKFRETTLNNSVRKTGEYRLQNSGKLAFAIDPISGEVSLRSAASRQQCVPYRYIAMPGMLCTLMTVTYQGESSVSGNGALELLATAVNPLLTRFHSLGLAVAYTFDEKLWRTLANTSDGNAAQLADTFLTAPQKSGNQSTMKVFFPNSFISAVATEGNIADITELVTLCFSASGIAAAADFCFKPGHGMEITPVAPNVEILPDVPDYKLDPNGRGGSGKGRIGDASPLVIPYTIQTTSAEPAIAINVRVTGSSRSLNGKEYCLFKGLGGAGAPEVPVPGELLAGYSHQRFAHNCAGRPVALPAPASSPDEWQQIPSHNEAYQVWRTPLILNFTMNDPVSQKTFSGHAWEGVINAQGTIEVSASWR